MTNKSRHCRLFFVIRTSTLIGHPSFGFGHLLFRRTPSSVGMAAIQSRINCSTWLALAPGPVPAIWHLPVFPE